MPRNPFRRQVRAQRYSSHQVAIPAVAESVKQMATKLEGWQGKVLRYADLVPEVMVGWAFVHNVMDRVSLEMQRWDREEAAWVADTSPEMKGIERRVNQGLRLGRAAALLHLVEECYVLVSREGKAFRFDTLAPTEIRTKNDKTEERVLVDGQKDDWRQIASDTTIIRVYRPDAKDRNRAGGPHKAMLGLLETMALEILQGQAESINVLAGNGILAIPTELIPDEGDPDDPAPGTQRHFEDRLEDAMLATITDRSKGEAVVPITVYGPSEHLEKIRHVTLNRDSSYESGKRTQDLIERYANDVDLPKQVILGIGDTNHWTDWKVDENTWAYHLEPRAQLIADAIYAGLVRSIVSNLEQDPADFRLAPNATAAIAKPDMSNAAGDAYARGAITPEAYVEAIGMDPSDMREDAEELQIALVERSSGPVDAEQGEGGNTPPTRAAAGRSPMTILRQMSRIANAHERKLATIYQRALERIADDAARSGRATRAAEAKDKTAASKVTFLGYDPAAYFNAHRDVFEQGTVTELLALLRRVATLTGMDFAQLKQVWSNEFQQRANAVAAEAEQIAKDLSRRSFDKGKPQRIPRSTVRSLTTSANGGVTKTNGRAGNTQRPTHAGEDPVVRDALDYSVGTWATQYEWKVGHPDRPFHPHQQLAGRKWFSWEEFDELDSSQDNPWLPGNSYFPGDHDGCLCEYEINFVPKEAP